MRRVLFSACAGLALLAGVSFATPASAAVGVPRLEQHSNGNGGTTAIAVVRISLFDLYGDWPQGFEPQASRPIPKGTDLALKIDSENEGYYAAKLYWRWNSNSKLFEPKVSLFFYESYSVDDVIALGPIDLDINSPTGAPFTNPQGEAIVNPITFTPVREPSPTMTGFGF